MGVKIKMPLEKIPDIDIDDYIYFFNLWWPEIVNNNSCYFRNCEWPDLFNRDCYYLKKGCEGCLLKAGINLNASSTSSEERK